MKRIVPIFVALTAAVFLFAASCSKPPGRAEYDRGLYELKRDNAVRARAMFEKSIARRPGSEENALAYNYLGVAAWKLGQYKTAQEAFEDSRRLSPTIVEPVYNLALLYLHEGNEVRAMQLLQEASQIDEEDPRPLEYLGQLYMERQQWPAARRALYAALGRAPNSARILSSLAVVDLYQSGPAKSIESHLIALEKDSRYAPALFNIGLLYQTRLQDPERAHGYFKRFLAQKPSGPAADFARAALSPESRPASPARDEDAAPAPLLPAASTASPAVQPPAAPVTPVAPIAPPSRGAPPSTAEIIQQATARSERGDATGALDQLLQAASDAGRAGRVADQEALLRSATQVAFGEARGYTALGDFLMERQDAASALRAYKQAVALDGQSDAAQFSMARAALKAGEVDAALIGLNAAVRLNPHDPNAQWELARVLDAQVQAPERAISAYRDFEKRFPSDPRARQIPDRIKKLTPLARAATQPQNPRPAPQTTPPPAMAPVPPPKPVEELISRQPEPASTDRRRPEPRVVSTPAAPARPAKPLPDLGLRPATVRNTSAATVAFNQGTYLLSQRQFNEAIHAFRRSLESDDRFTHSFYNLGLAYTQVGDREMAKAAYARALAVQPNLNSARYNLALLYFQTGDRAAAAALAVELVRQDPRDAAGHYLLGQIYSERSDTLPDARAAYSRFLDLAPNHPSAPSVREWLATH